MPICSALVQWQMCAIVGSELKAINSKMNQQSIFTQSKLHDCTIHHRNVSLKFKSVHFFTYTSLFITSLIEIKDIKTIGIKTSMLYNMLNRSKVLSENT